MKKNAVIQKISEKAITLRPLCSSRIPERKLGKYIVEDDLSTPHMHKKTYHTITLTHDSTTKPDN